MYTATADVQVPVNPTHLNVTHVYRTCHGKWLNISEPKAKPMALWPPPPLCCCEKECSRTGLCGVPGFPDYLESVLGSGFTFPYPSNVPKKQRGDSSGNSSSWVCVPHTGDPEWIHRFCLPPGHAPATAATWEVTQWMAHLCKASVPSPTHPTPSLSLPFFLSLSPHPCFQVI